MILFQALVKLFFGFVLFGTNKRECVETVFEIIVFIHHEAVHQFISRSSSTMHSAFPQCILGLSKMAVF